ncbi:MAG: hypothetical protein IJG84_15265 [Kiritimatiellae bacterium]|nr:hypothetical protein [Kiritimatiellia bacterium]
MAVKAGASANHGQAQDSLMGRFVAVPSEPHFAGALDRVLTLALSARPYALGSKPRRTRESALVRHRLSAPRRESSAQPKAALTGRRASERTLGGAAWLRGGWFTSVVVCESKSQRLG